MKVNTLWAIACSAAVLVWSAVPARCQVDVSAPFKMGPYAAVESRRVDKDLVLGGVDLASKGYSGIFRYVLLDSNTIIFQGYTKGAPGVPQENQLCSLSLVDQRITVIKRYSDRENMLFGRMCLFHVRASTRHSEERPSIMLLYPKGNYANGFTEYETWIEILDIGSDGQYHTSASEQVGHANEFYAPVPEAPYRRVQYDKPDYVPARQNLVKVLFVNMNNDTAIDVLIWRRVAVSRRKDDPTEDDYSRSEEFEVLMNGANGYVHPRKLTDVESNWLRALPLANREQLWQASFP